MRYLYILFISTLSFSFSFSQGFSVSPSHSNSATIQTNEYVTSQILFTNTTVDSLFLSWNLLEKITPIGWDYSYCDYNSCYDATKIEGTMAAIPAGGNGFIKVNGLFVFKRNFQVNSGDKIKFLGNKNSNFFFKISNNQNKIPSNFEVNFKKLEGIFLRKPLKKELMYPEIFCFKKCLRRLEK